MVLADIIHLLLSFFIYMIFHLILPQRFLILRRILTFLFAQSESLVAEFLAVIAFVQIVLFYHG